MEGNIMSKRYEFVCYDDEDQTRTVVEFETESDAWSGYNGPMYNFFNFLKGCGFVFHHNTEIGVVKETGEFVAAADPFPSYVGGCCGGCDCDE
jgi:hypothetical protein